MIYFGPISGLKNFIFSTIHAQRTQTKYPQQEAWNSWTDCKTQGRVLQELMKVGWFLPLTLADPYFIAIKAGVDIQECVHYLLWLFVDLSIPASLTAAMSMYIADNPDLVSACFIAIVCISPTPLLGLKSYVLTFSICFPSFKVYNLHIS